MGKKSRRTIWLSVNKIKFNPQQPRQTVPDPIKLEELQGSMDEHGMKDPVSVKKSKTHTKDGTYDLIAGERRLRSALALKWREIECFEMPANVDAFMWALVENMMREELNPIDEALAIYRLKYEYKMNQAQISRSLGKDDGGYFVSTRLKLLKLPETLKAYVQEGKISVGIGLIFARRCTSETDVLKHFEMLCDRVHGITRLSESLVEAYFEEELERKKARRAPRRLKTDAELVRGPRERPMPRTSNGHAAVHIQNESVLEDELPSELLPITSGAVFIADFDRAMGVGDKNPAQIRAWWEGLPRTERKKFLQVKSMIETRFKRLDYLTKSNDNEVSA